MAGVSLRWPWEGEGRPPMLDERPQRQSAQRYEANVQGTVGEVGVDATHGLALLPVGHAVVAEVERKRAEGMCCVSQALAYVIGYVMPIPEAGAVAIAG